MITPNLGDVVKIWPFPGINVQDGQRTLDNGGRWLAAEGREVKWSEFHLEQLRAGDILLHAPPAPLSVSQPSLFSDKE